MYSLQFLRSTFSIPERSNFSQLKNPIKSPKKVRFPTISPCLVPDSGSTEKQPSSKTKEVMDMEAILMVGSRPRYPIVIESGKGCILYDVDGKEYLDMTAGNALGHGDPYLVKAVKAQTNNLAEITLAERLVECSFADRVFFADSGTEANEVAMEISRNFQRFVDQVPATELVAFTRSLRFHEQPGVTFVQYGSIEEAKRAIQKGKTAAVFVEPVQCEGGIYTATKDFLQALRTFCDEAGALLVFDEIQCGVGRTGHLWAHEAFDVEPDMMTLAQPLAGALPIGVVLLTEKIAAAIASGLGYHRSTFGAIASGYQHHHGNTFSINPMVCHAALAVLHKIQEHGFLAGVRTKGLYLKKILTEKLLGNPHVKEVRGIGLMVGIEFHVDAFPLADACREAGLLVLIAGKGGNVIRLEPSLIISEKELEQAAEIIVECLPVLGAGTS